MGGGRAVDTLIVHAWSLGQEAPTQQLMLFHVAEQDAGILRRSSGGDPEAIGDDARLGEGSPPPAAPRQLGSRTDWVRAVTNDRVQHDA